MESTDIETDFKAIKAYKHRKDWEPFLRKYHCDIVCELGVFAGGNFFEMIKHQPKLAVAVDTWKNDGVHTPKDAKYTQEFLENQYQDFKKKVAHLAYVKVVRSLTTTASFGFPDRYFDFVYIDADHSVTGCENDILHWYPKVKPGKFLAGHDYRRGFGVVEAVDRFVKANNLDLMRLPPSTWAIIKK